MQESFEAQLYIFYLALVQIGGELSKQRHGHFTPGLKPR